MFCFLSGFKSQISALFQRNYVINLSRSVSFWTKCWSILSFFIRDDFVTNYALDMFFYYFLAISVSQNVVSAAESNVTLRGMGILAYLSAKHANQTFLSECVGHANTVHKWMLATWT